MKLKRIDSISMDQTYAGDYHWFNPVGERLPLCGGGWYNGAHAGVFGLDLGDPRSNANWHRGFRSAFVDL